MPSGIYHIFNRVTGKRYIGSAVNINARWSVHRNNLRGKKHHSIHLQRAWDKHGEASFEFSVLEETPIAELIAREQHHIDLLDGAGYNIAPRAGHTLGAKRTAEQIEKTASKARGRKLSEEHCRKIGEASRGRRHTLATKAKMRAARLTNNHQVGRPLTEKQKVALFKSGENHPWFGRKHSAATCAFFSELKSVPVIQVLHDGTERLWKKPREAAAELGLRGTSSIYRAVHNPKKKAAGFSWRPVVSELVAA